MLGLCLLPFRLLPGYGVVHPLLERSAVVFVRILPLGGEMQIEKMHSFFRLRLPVFFTEPVVFPLEKLDPAVLPEG